MAMVRGALRCQIYSQSARSGMQLRAPAEHLLARSCSTSILVGCRRLLASSDAWTGASRRRFAQASANDAANNSDQKVESKAEDATVGDKEEVLKKGTPEDQRNAAQAEPMAEPKEAAPEDPDAKLRREVEELQSEMKAGRHQVLLALADYENDKKKLVKERDSRHRRAIVGFATRMVDVYGIFATKLPDKLDTTGDSQASLQEGIGLVRQAFASTLGRFDVKPLSISSGEYFTVARHESIGTVIGSDHADGVVAEIVKPGWILQPSKGAPAVLARAQVKVARSGPSASPLS